VEIGKDDLHKKMRTRPSIRQGRSRSVLEMPVYITGHVGGRLLHGRKENTRGTSITETEDKGANGGAWMYTNVEMRVLLMYVRTRA
jgi:hypothetical protein